MAKNKVANHKGVSSATMNETGTTFDNDEQVFDLKKLKADKQFANQMERELVVILGKHIRLGFRGENIRTTWESGHLLDFRSARLAQPCWLSICVITPPCVVHLIIAKQVPLHHGHK